jgi:penicillin amidase
MPHTRFRARCLAQLALYLCTAGCTQADDGPPPVPPPSASPVESVVETSTVQAPGLSAIVDVVRDEYGVPHIYAQSFADAAFAQGYFMAQDRLVMMDLGRRSAEGTLAELLGDLSPTLVDQDIDMRVHHLGATAAQTLAALRASSDEQDKALVTVLEQFAAGVNTYIREAQADSKRFPQSLVLVYDIKSARPWRPEDSIELGLLQAFDLSFDADSEITFSAIDAAAAMQFDGSADPQRAARKGIGADLQILAPVDPTFTLPTGWPAQLVRREARRQRQNDLRLLQKARLAVRGIGDDHTLRPAIGSNNWVVGPALSVTGNPLLANDTHLQLTNPPVFYLQHLKVKSAAQQDSIMGVQFAGLPGIVLGMNEHLAWGSTVNQIDVTDVYRETVTPCDNGTDPCVLWKGNKVALVPRKEVFNIGLFGKASGQLTLTFYDVPHHGPILPRVTANHMIEPLGKSELSIRYTGYEPVQLLRALWGVNKAHDMGTAIAALERDFKVGRQNWVFIDDHGHIGWTQATRVPRRAAGFAPWKILPGDGTAEWQGDLDSKYIPRAIDPPQGYLVTANNDPIGVTAQNDPFFGQPKVDGLPLYLAADYDTGTRAGRITKRIVDRKTSGQKMTISDMADIQADHVTEYGQALQPTLRAAADGLVNELMHPGSQPELTPLLATASADVKAALPAAASFVRAWSADTPSALAAESPSAGAITDSQATLVYSMWVAYLNKLALGDELAVLGVSTGSDARTRLLIRMCNDPASLKTGVHPRTGDALLFDDMTTPEIETRSFIAAKALVSALASLIGRLGTDATKWRWGQLHTVRFGFPAGLAALDLPPSDDPTFPAGFPRPGTNGTVDVGPHGLSTTNFTFEDGAAIRFVCEMTPTGPRARNVLPGGEIFDPESPHYRDQAELWRQNRAFDLAFQDDEVVKSATVEQQQRGLGRTRFVPMP